MKPSGSSSSGDEDDGDARWKARIRSVAAAADGVSGANGSARRQGSDLGVDGKRSSGPKLYQIKAMKFLDDTLDKSLVFVQDLNAALNKNAQAEDCGVRLFRKAPPGINFDFLDVNPRPKKRPRIIPGEEIDEKSTKFRRQICHAAVEGVDIMASAKDAIQRSLAKFEARDASAKAAAKREEERVAELKKIRGEKWLPTIARQKAGKKHKKNLQVLSNLTYSRWIEMEVEALNSKPKYNVRAWF